MPIQREIKNFVVHDDDKCYCKDTLNHLKENEERYYLLKKLVNLNVLNNDTMKKCSFYNVRQRLLEWLIVVQNHYSSSEETLEMAIRLFDYIYFKDLYSNNYDKLFSGENNNNVLANNNLNNYRSDEESSNDSRFNWNYTDEDSDNEIMPDGNNNSKKKKLSTISIRNENKENEHCSCGSSHNGWIQLEELQLVALTCFFLSAKFWERFPPKMSKLINLTEFEYSESQVLKKEKQILSITNFDMKIPLVSQYLDFYVLHESVFLLNKIVPVSHYLCNLTLTDSRFLNRLASTLAATIITFSKMILCSFASCNPDESRLVYDTTLFSVMDFKVVLNDLWSAFKCSVENKEAYKLQRMKFSDQKYSYLPLYIENVGTIKIQKYYEELQKFVNSFVSAN